MNRKSILYIVPGVDLEALKFIGVKSKIKQQCTAFKNLEYEPTLLYFTKGNAVFEDANGKKCCYRISDFMVMCNHYSYVLRKHILKESKFDVIYVRKTVETPLSLYTSSKLRTYAECLIYEVPTYPYDTEYETSIKESKGKTKLVKQVGFICDKLCRIHLKKHIDFFAIICNFGKYNRIFGASAVMISNGINVSEYKFRKWIPKSKIILLAVANIQLWHGYDRVIKGLGSYYATGGTIDIEFHVVGEGRVKEDLVKLAANQNLNKRIIFHGVKSGTDLDELFDSADIGISVIGGYRQGAHYASPIKVREYCARGLPYVTAINDFDIPDDFTWNLCIPNDDTPLDIASVIEFYSICVSRKNDIYEMRLFAEKKLSWETQLEKVINHLPG